MTVGPVQYVAFGFGPGTEFEGAIVDELDRLYARGTIRVLDLAVVRRGEDGSLTSLRASGLTLREAADSGDVIRKLLGIAGDNDVLVEAVELVQPELLDAVEVDIVQDDLQPYIDDLQPGAAVMVVLLEHTWATRFAAIVRAEGGTTLTQGLITPELRELHGAELQAVSDSAAAIELAAAVEGAAYLDALRSLDQLRYLKSALAAETVRVLMAAGLLQDEAAGHALDALWEADMLQDRAMAEADMAVALAEAEMAAVEAEFAADNQPEAAS